MNLQMKGMAGGNPCKAIGNAVKAEMINWSTKNNIEGGSTRINKKRNTNLKHCTAINFFIS